MQEALASFTGAISHLKLVTTKKIFCPVAKRIKLQLD